ncbi:hypothetical protein ACB035_20490, partial [Aeromonas sp. S12(2024)]|uniref:hypothetical protein n=1 Tax=Aeromonas sp. S12(2024) TaxID=3242885 RepID=UPI0035274916
DGTHSCYNSAEKVFYKGRYDFDARGMRRNDTLSGWPVGKTLAGAFRHWDGKTYFMWNDQTHSTIEIKNGSLDGIGVPISNWTRWISYPTEKKTLVAASRVANYWFMLLWSDGTHSAADTNGFPLLTIIPPSRYRPNGYYGLPTTKTVCAADYLGVENSFRVFWHDGTHSQIEGSLVTNRDGFDAQGYRSNSA